MVYQNKIYTIRKPFKLHTMLLKPLYLVKGQRSYEAVEITLHLHWASGLIAVTLIILKCQFMVW